MLLTECVCVCACGGGGTGLRNGDSISLHSHLLPSLRLPWTCKEFSGSEPSVQTDLWNAGPSTQARLTCHRISSVSPEPTYLFIYNRTSALSPPCNTTLPAKELERLYQPAPTAWIASLINKIIIPVVIPLNRSFCKYLNPINKVF